MFLNNSEGLSGRWKHRTSLGKSSELWHGKYGGLCQRSPMFLYFRKAVPDVGCRKWQCRVRCFRLCVPSPMVRMQFSPRKKFLKKILHFLHPSGKLPLYALLFGCRMGCSMAPTGCRIGEGFGGKGVFCVLFSAFSSCRKPADVERNVGKLQDYQDYLAHQ